MPTLQFSKNIRRRGRQVINAATEITRRTAKASLEYLVRNTKVDTGEARSNWRVGVGAPTRSVIKPYTPYKKGSKANGLGISETANANAAIAAGRARINAVRGVPGVGLKTAIYVSNHTPHIDQALLPGALEGAIAAASAQLRFFKVFDPANDDDDGGDL